MAWERKNKIEEKECVHNDAAAPCIKNIIYLQKEHYIVYSCPTLYTGKYNDQNESLMLHTYQTFILSLSHTSARSYNPVFVLSIMSRLLTLSYCVHNHFFYLSDENSMLNLALDSASPVEQLCCFVQAARREWAASAWRRDTKGLSPPPVTLSARHVI